MSTRNAALTRILSGGQTGVDRAALDVAIELGIPCGGWCPKGRRSENGPIPDAYGLQETESADYRERTERNVTESDGTLLITTGRLTGGTALTAKIAGEAGKQLLVIHLDSPVEPDRLRAWVRRAGIRVLNVAGPRESQRPGIGAQAHHFLRTQLELLQCSRPADET